MKKEERTKLRKAIEFGEFTRWLNSYGSAPVLALLDLAAKLEEENDHLREPWLVQFFAPESGCFTFRPGTPEKPGSMKWEPDKVGGRGPVEVRALKARIAELEKGIDDVLGGDSLEPGACHPNQEAIDILEGLLK